MAKVVQIGGGIVGLCTGMLLAKDGHEVTVLERDAAPTTVPDAAWDGWPRTGVNQFRLLHYLQPGFARITDRELPAIPKALQEAGAIHHNTVAEVPDEIKGGAREGDDRYATWTARRPVAEAAIAQVANETPGLTIRRGVAVAGLLVGRDNGNVPNVVGVRTEDGEEVRGDLVIDAGGRRSQLPSWLTDAGAQPLLEERDDCGFVYYGRHFRSGDGSVPFAFGPPLYPFGSASVLTLPADNGTWGVGLIVSAKDAALRGLRHADRWEAVMKSLPMQAHWLDGEPIDDDIAVMAKIEDRHRSLVVDGQPVATGVLPVADAWACTNPSVGRGISIGMIHALALRDYLRTAPMDDPVTLVKGWEDATASSAEPWYRATRDFDRHRLAEIEALMNGERYEPDDVGFELGQAVFSAVMKDPSGDCLRAVAGIGSVLDLPEEVLADPALAEKVVTLGADWRNDEIAGPSRDELVKLAGG
jgi:2-polyprenyl-6-methoxyphenol hydroxylase-like FAD-dependent oxidoreductase